MEEGSGPISNPRPDAATPPPEHAVPSHVHAAPATDRQALAIALLVAWILGGAHLLLWVDTKGLLENDILTPWHIPAYFGVGAVVVYLIGLARRAVSQRHPRGLVPPELGGTVIGAAMLVLYLPLEVVWSALVGQPEDFERTTAVPRLWFGVAILALASGPIVVALRRTAPRRLGALSLALVLAAGSVGATITFFANSFTATTLDAGLRPPVEFLEGTAPDMELHRISIDGRSNEVIAIGPELREPSLSPDGSEIISVWWDQQPGDSRVTAELMALAPNGARRGVQTSDDEWKGGVSFSPDGRRGVYAATTFGPRTSATEPSFGPQQAPAPGGEPAPLIFSGPGGDWDIDMVDFDTGEVTTLVGGPSQEGRPAWSPDGSKVAYYSSVGGSLDIWMVDVDSGEKTQLTSDPGSEWGVSWSPDGRRLAFGGDGEGQMRIYTVDVATREVTRLTDGPNSDWLPAWSPDGEWIAFASDRNTKIELWLVQNNGSGFKRLTNTWDRYPEMTPDGWAADGQSLIYTSRELFPDEGPDPDDRLAVASFALAGATLGVVVGLLVAGGGAFPLGAALAVLMALALLPLAAVEPRWVAPAVVAGLVVEGLVWLWRRRPWTPVRGGLLAALGAAAWAVAFFLVGDQTGELRWHANLLATAIVLAGLAAFAAAAAIVSGRRELRAEG